MNDLLLKCLIALWLIPATLILLASCEQKDQNTEENHTKVQDNINVEDIVAKHLEAIGGVEAHRAQTTRKMEGSISIMGGPAGKLTVTQKAPDSKHSRMEMPGGAATLEGYDGQVAWQQTPGLPVRQLSGQELRSKAGEARFYTAIEMATADDLTYERYETYKGESYHVLKGRYPDSDNAYFLYIHDTTHLAGVMKMPAAGMPGEIAIELEDYRAVDGMQLAHRMTVLMQSNPFMSISFDKITHGIEVDDSLFALPEN